MSGQLQIAVIIKDVHRSATKLTCTLLKIIDLNNLLWELQQEIPGFSCIKLFLHVSIGHGNNIPTMQYFTGIPEILSQNLLCYH